MYICIYACVCVCVGGGYYDAGFPHICVTTHNGDVSQHTPQQSEHMYSIPSSDQIRSGFLVPLFNLCLAW